MQSESKSIKMSTIYFNEFDIGYLDKQDYSCLSEN